MSEALFSTSRGVFGAVVPLDRVGLRHGESQLEVIGTTLCEADRRSLNGSKEVSNRPRSVVPGHEAVGCVTRTQRGSGLRRGDVVCVMPHLIPEDQRQSPSFERGDIFALRTLHAGMHCDGTMSTHMIWPTECLRRIPMRVIHDAAVRAGRLGVHWSLPMAEIEHVACVLTSFELAQAAERVWNVANFSRLQQGEGRVVIAGAGWMGWLWYLHLTRVWPLSRILIRDPNEARLRLFVQLARQVTGRSPQVFPIGDTSLDESFDVAVSATSARSAPRELFPLLRTGGHLVLFSGIHDGAADLLFDPARLCDLERIHRDGIHTPIYRTSDHSPDDMVIASGSSGYSVACFGRAVEEIGCYVDGIAAGISGVVLGVLSSRLQSLRDWAPDYTRSEGGPVFKSLLGNEWPGRLAHFKIGLHPNVTDDIRRLYMVANPASQTVDSTSGSRR